VELKHEGSNAQIIVEDTGKGISPEALPHIFERFYQHEDAGFKKPGGLGLGLALVRHLVELHGGTVKAEIPGEGQGAIFKINLPLRLSGAAASSKKEFISQSMNSCSPQLL